MVSITVNTKEFDKAMKEYLKYSKRTFVEAINQHAYYTARNATQTTYAADKEAIRRDLEKPAEVYPEVPLAAILVNKELASKGKKGLTGEKMRVAVEKFIKKKQSHRNFLRAGWIPAIKKLASVVPKKNGTKIPSGTAKKGRNFGGATAAKDAWKTVCSIWNSALGKDESSRAVRYVEEGAQKALDKEVGSMLAYIERKQGEGILKFWGF